MVDLLFIVCVTEQNFVFSMVNEKNTCSFLRFRCLESCLYFHFHGSLSPGAFSSFERVLVKPLKKLFITGVRISC